MATDVKAVKVTISRMPLRRLKVATWLVRHGLAGMARRLIDGAPIRIRIGSGSSSIIGRIVTRADGTARIE